MTKHDHKFLIIGIGNTLRGDDGIGAYVCSCIDRLRISGVKTLVTQQLHIELLEDFIQSEQIILVDAAIEGEEVNFYPDKSTVASPVSSSHHVDGGVLVSLVKQLYQRNVSLWVCAVKGEIFDMGNGLSEKAKHNADKAVNIMLEWIRIKG